MEKIKLGVICGGMSTENEVSVVSASYVLSNLNKEKYEIYPVYIDKNGQWWEILDEFKPRKFGEEITKKEKIENEFKYLKNLDVIFPVLHGLYAESTFDGTFTEGATFDKSAFKKTLSVYNLFVDADWEACTDYKIEAPDTVRVNGTGDHAGRFVITITSGQWSYELAYQVVKGGTADPGDSEVGGGQEVDWLGYYTLAGKSYIEDEYIDGAISIYGNINVPEEYADEYEILHWGILYSRTNSTPTWDSYENYSLVLQNSFNQSLPFEFLFDNTRAPLKNGDLVYFRTYLALKRKEDTSSTPKQYFFYSNTVLPLTIRDYR